jgi:hypothetical protein
VKKRDFSIFLYMDPHPCHLPDAGAEYVLSKHTQGSIVPPYRS